MKPSPTKRFAAVAAVATLGLAACGDDGNDTDSATTAAPAESAEESGAESGEATAEAAGTIVDVAVDQGGCIATTRETTHDDPVFEQHGVVHYAVGNMPGAVPHTSTYALTNATLPFQLQVALHGAVAAGRRDAAIEHGINTVNGQHTNAIVAESLDATAVNVFEV